MKNKDAIIVILLIIILVLVVGGITYISISNNNAKKNTTKIEVTTEKNEANNDGEKEANKTEDNSTNLGAAYVKYSNIEWHRKQIVDALDWGVEIYIDSEINKVKFIYTDLETDKEKTVTINNIEGTPKYVVGRYDCGGYQQSVILTEEGIVYISGQMMTGNIPAYEYKKLNLEEKIVDVATLQNKRPMTCSTQEFYFLTETGKLINVYGETYEEVNEYFKKYVGGPAYTIYIYNDDTIGYIGYDGCDDSGCKENRNKFKYNGKEVIAKNIFAVEAVNKEGAIEGTYIYIYTNDGKLLMKSEEGHILTLHSSNVNNVETTSQEEVKVNYKDGTSTIFKNTEVWL